MAPSSRPPASQEVRPHHRPRRARPDASTRARSTASSAPTAPGSPRPSASCSACCAPTAARSRLLGARPVAATPPSCTASSPTSPATWSCGPTSPAARSSTCSGGCAAASTTRRAATSCSRRFELDPTKKGRSYSKGNRQKVALVAALASDVPLLVLDEPTSGLDPLMEKVFQEHLAQVRAEGRTVLLSSHILSEVEAAADRVSIVRAGRDRRHRHARRPAPPHPHQRRRRPWPARCARPRRPRGPASTPPAGPRPPRPLASRPARSATCCTGSARTASQPSPASRPRLEELFLSQYRDDLGGPSEATGHASTAEAVPGMSSFAGTGALLRARLAPRPVDHRRGALALVATAYGVDGGHPRPLPRPRRGGGRRRGHRRQPVADRALRPPPLAHVRRASASSRRS